MKFHSSTLVALLLGTLPLLASAQSASAPVVLPDLPAPPGASAPAATRPGAPAPGPRLRSAAETGGSAAAPGELKPERPVAPQISIPFGKKAPPPTLHEESLVQRGSADSRNGVDDAAARCEALTDTSLRSQCRARLAHGAKTELPR